MRNQLLYTISTANGFHTYVYTLAEALKLTGYEDVDTAFVNGVYIEPVYNECDISIIEEN